MKIFGFLKFDEVFQGDSQQGGISSTNTYVWFFHFLLSIDLISADQVQSYLHRMAKFHVLAAIDKFNA